MKKAFIFVLGCCMFLLSACNRQETAEISSVQAQATDIKSEISGYIVSDSAASSELPDTSSSVSSVSYQTNSRHDEIMQIKWFADDIIEFGLTVGRLSGDPSAPKQQTVSTTDTALIQEIVDKINSLLYVRDLKMESDHRYTNGISWEFWTKHRNGQKTTYQYSGYHYLKNGKRYHTRDGFDLLEYLKDKLNATWW